MTELRPDLIARRAVSGQRTDGSPDRIVRDGPDDQRPPRSSTVTFRVFQRRRTSAGTWI